MQLTCAVLGSFTKYPRPSLVDNFVARGISSKKFGFIQHDQKAFESVASELGLKRKCGQDAWFRHPLAFLVEVADDICYGIMDIEDGFRSGHLSFAEVEGLFEAVLDSVSMEKAGAMELKSTELSICARRPSTKLTYPSGRSVQTKGKGIAGGFL